MVTTDTTLDRNIVAWEKNIGLGIKYYKIYVQYEKTNIIIPEIFKMIRQD